LKHHLKQTKEQQGGLEQLISRLGGMAMLEAARLLMPLAPKDLANTMKKINYRG
jgi:hypothetical protein